MAIFETFKLSELRLDEENFRTGSTASQRDAIHAVIADQKEKLVNLAKDILVEGGLSPGEPIWVFRDPVSNFYVSVEGNRRVTALKLLENPSLADGTEIEKPFRELAKRFAASPIRDLQACVFSSREEAAPWVRKRHLRSGSGVGLEPWKPMAKNRANRAHGEDADKSLAVVEFLQDGSADWETIADALDPKWTTVDRVLNTAAMKDTLGIHIEKNGTIIFENGDVSAGRKLLRQILGEMTRAEVDSRSLDKVEDRVAFIKRFEHLAVKAKPAASKPGTGKPVTPSPPLPKSKPAQPTKRTKLDTTARKTLAPKTGARTFQVDGVRLNGLYAECRKLVVETNENGAALLLRVFIELSSEALLSEKGIAIPPRFAAKAANWDDIGIPLSVKVSCVLGVLDSTGKAKSYQPIRVAIDPQSNSIASINTLHAYFHNRAFNPLAGDLMKAWDVWEGYLSALHGAR
ncbi:hypothetical protein [Sphingomonas flavalba]|uniref:hypothetical protein n=1 Tax=Sphingomonas flavalba TaxID=2559804 RepID=UPI00109E29CC|nr:hypothetical protein [Sphingomonas flavalba]